MFEISELKAKTLADLQQIAKSIGLTKTSQLNKLDLVYQILDIQAASPSKEEEKIKSEKPRARIEKPKRKRVLKISQDNTKPSELKTVEKIIPEPKEVERVEKTATIEIKEQKIETSLVNKPQVSKPQNQPKPQHLQKPAQQKKPDQQKNPIQQKNDNNPKNTSTQNNKNKPKENNREKNTNVSRGNKSNNRYKDPDFEFDGIIELSLIHI